MTAPAAHVLIDPPTAQAGSTLKLSLRIGHGCGASPTREVSVDIPAGARGARPVPKPGWALSIERAPLASPYTRHGRPVTDDVVRVTWTARAPQDMLDTAHTDDFSVVVTVPEDAGRLDWPVRQVCPDGHLDWIQGPGAASPAAALEVRPVPSPASAASLASQARPAGQGHATSHLHHAH